MAGALIFALTLPDPADKGKVADGAIIVLRWLGVMATLLLMIKGIRIISPATPINVDYR